MLDVLFAADDVVAFVAQAGDGVAALGAFGGGQTHFAVTWQAVRVVVVVLQAFLTKDLYLAVIGIVATHTCGSQRIAAGFAHFLWLRLWAV